MELRWNARWAEVAGADGHLVTDIVGRIIPTWTAEQLTALRQARRDLNLTTNGLINLSHAAYELAERNGLRAVVACAAQSGERAATVHVHGEPGTRQWEDSLYHTTAARDAAQHTAMALVIRQHAPAELTNGLTAVWRAVLGELREPVPLAPATGSCLCGRPPGDVVFAADAARQIRNTVDGFLMERAWKDEALATANQALTEQHRTHIARADVTAALTAALNEAPKLGAPTRRWLETRLGLAPAIAQPTGAR